MNWRQWPVDKQARWVFRMTVCVFAVGLVVGLVLQVVLR